MIFIHDRSPHSQCGRAELSLDPELCSSRLRGGCEWTHPGVLAVVWRHGFGANGPYTITITDRQQQSVTSVMNYGRIGLGCRSRFDFLITGARRPAEPPFSASSCWSYTIKPISVMYNFHSAQRTSDSLPGLKIQIVDRWMETLSRQRARADGLNHLGRSRMGKLSCWQ